MDGFRPMQALMRLGSALALGALALGVIGALLAWMSTGADAALPLVLLAPGLALLGPAGAFAALALRSRPENWPETYRSCSRIALGAAGVATLAAILAGFALGLRAASVAQAILVVLLGLEGPLALWLSARRLRSLADAA